MLLGQCAGAVAQSGTFSAVSEYAAPTAHSRPSGITAGPDGNVWFTESDVNKIGRVTTSGVFTEFTVPFSLPNGIVAGPDGNLWVTDEASKIDRITPSGAVTRYQVPTINGYPSGITVGPDGALWFTEYIGNKIGRVTTAGIVTEYPIPTVGSGPTGITAAGGSLWFTEFGSSKIGQMSTAGVVVAEYYVPTPFAQPDGITAGPDGAVWFTEFYGNKIGRITTAGVITEYPVPTVNGGPVGITASPDGALWFTEYNNVGAIARITTAGLITEYAVPTASSQPDAIAVGPDGGLWFGEYNSGKIGRAPVCGLGFSASFAGGTLTMNFNLGITVPTTFNIFLHSSAGNVKAFSQGIPPVMPPSSFTFVWTSLPNVGMMTVQPSLAVGVASPLCTEWTTVNTAMNRTH